MTEQHPDVNIPDLDDSPPDEGCTEGPPLNLEDD